MDEKRGEMLRESLQLYAPDVLEAIEGRVMEIERWDPGATLNGDGPIRTAYCPVIEASNGKERILLHVDVDSTDCDNLYYGFSEFDVPDDLDWLIECANDLADAAQNFLEMRGVVEVSPGWINLELLGERTIDVLIDSGILPKVSVDIWKRAKQES